jgi:alkanesulfonate monooxygenase SsuD/methylene tetrahydromethanopterin reductase-like flavin-dependent oxidoreductase (luciferase family)
VNEHLLARLGLERTRLEASGLLSVLMGTPERMCDQLLELRDSVGISYVTVADYHMDTLAPVVERLASR